MNRLELEQLMRNGESSGVDFKRDDVPPDKLAKVAAAFLNLEGGHILLGVEDDGTVSGLSREPRRAEEWVMQVLRDNVQPSVIPFWETIAWDDAKIVGVVTLPADFPDKPYKVKRGSGAWVTPVRVGTTPVTRAARRSLGSTCSPGIFNTTASRSRARAWTTSTCGGSPTTSAMFAGKTAPILRTAKVGPASSSTRS